MPNWCNNYLMVEGKPKDLNKMLKQIEITESEATMDNPQSLFSCNKVIPQPIFPDDKAWYEWNIANWGSKWDLCDVELREKDSWEKGIVQFSFNTAWSPVIQVITTLAKEHKKLSFTYQYEESGADYWGKHLFSKGEEVFYEGGEISTANCDVLEDIFGFQHHWCRECGDDVHCQGSTDSTPDMCENCMENEQMENDPLWDTEEETENTNGNQLVSN
jgi:hypothetical protein